MSALGRAPASTEEPGPPIAPLLSLGSAFMSRSLGSFSDAQVAQLAAQGDRDAFGELYDRFGSPLYDFCARLTGSAADAADVTHEVFIRAASRLPQLREPERVRAWLFSVARHECYAHTRKRSKTLPSDPMRFGETLEQPGRTAGGLVETDELVELVTAARGGLESDDLTLLDLRFRHDLSGADLAEAAGVPHEHLHKAMARATERMEKSLAAVVLLRHGRRDCAELAEVAGGFGDGVLDPLLRKRVSRHVDGCDTCTRRRRALVNPATMTASAASRSSAGLLPPTGLREAIVSSMVSGVAAPGASYGWKRSGFPRAVRRRRTLPTMALVGGLLVVSALVVRENTPPSFRAPTPPTSAAPLTTAAGVTTTPPVTTLAPVTTLVATTSTTTTTTTTTTPTTTLTPTTAVPTAVPTTKARVVPVTTKVVPTTRKPRRRVPVVVPTTTPVVVETVPPTEAPTLPPTVPPTTVEITQPPTTPAPQTTPPPVIVTTVAPVVPTTVPATTTTIRGQGPITTTTLKPCPPTVFCPKFPLTVNPTIVVQFTATTLPPPPVIR